MPRKPLIITRTFPYHVTNRSNNREWFYIPLDESWRIFTEILATCCERYKAEIHTFVLMSNHYHLMMSTPLGNLSQIIRYFQTEVCRAIQRRTGRINHVFGNRYKWSALTSAFAIAYCYKYVLRNPVAAGVCSSVESYPYSTLFQILDTKAAPVPVVEGISPEWRFRPKNWNDRLDWLNRPSSKECNQILSKALRRAEFSFSKGYDTQKLISLLSYEYDIPIQLYTAPGTFSSKSSLEK